MGIPIGEGEVVFRCNLVAVRDGEMRDYSAGHITNEEAHGSSYRRSEREPGQR